ncbi:ATP-binding protein [Caballeronia sp. LZ029]|uniref:ATP-binding protein n=1 Tax=Caballeronia sp. LZ029 TaxID=3038564 RepID=UPI002856CCF9|nr:ATP-binding protein [Caballeronia sp. LZ029]MDR5744447.1 ATP-binding protein [Caballeronia sp. LZ029]
MLESLRGLGYSTATALADIIDNSVSALATSVDVAFSWDGELSRIHVLDDGRGMTDGELESAMRLGDKNPLQVRSSHDLGRFGMGLKTASLSQCRRLTVASKCASDRHCLRWDLDALEARRDDDWLLFEGAAPGSDAFLTPLDERQSGTLVLWERLDRIVTSGYRAEDYLDLIDRVECHLSMVFHRFLEGSRPRLNLTINGRKVLPWDPFMVGHPAKPWNSPVARKPTPDGLVEVECHVLPHKDRLTQAEFDGAAGPEGWTFQQGFYVYRNERLLVAGSWLGLGSGRGWNKEESQRLARIRLDIPNLADAAWKIDIRKSSARPPVALRPWLTRLAEDTRDRARKVFAFRASPVAQSGKEPVELAWRVEKTKSGIRYRIDPNNPAIRALLDAAGSLQPLVQATLKMIEETVPVQRIWLDTADNKDTPRTQFADEPPSNVISVLRVIYDEMVTRKGTSPENAKRMLANMEPFHNYPDLVAQLGATEA